MQKLVYLLLLIFLAQVTAFSQTAIIDEDFFDPLSDWEMEGNWMQEEGYLMLYYYPIVEDYDYSTYTPEFEVPVNGGDVIINCFIDVYQANTTDEVCEVSVMYGEQEEILWSHNLTEGAWGEIAGTDITLPMDDFIGETVKIRMRSYGSSTSALWGWFVFNVNFTTWFEHELCAMELSGPTNLDIMEEGLWQVKIKNQGLNTESDFNVNLFSQKDNQSIAYGSFDGDLNSGETGYVDIVWATENVHNTVLYAKIDSPMDQFENNDYSNGRFLRIESDAEYNILFWDNDNGIESVEQPETGILQEPHAGLLKAFQVSGINMEFVNSLPDNLEEYDIVVTTMGCYCLS